MLSRLRSLFRRAAPPPTIAATATGFAVRGGAEAAVAVAWAEVRRVVAFKRDLYTTDCIVLAVEYGAPSPAVVELSEEWPGFTDLFGTMETALGVSPSWYLEIMTPAFEPTMRVLFERAGGANVPHAPDGRAPDAGR